MITVALLHPVELEVDGSFEFDGNAVGLDAGRFMVEDDIVNGPTIPKLLDTVGVDTVAVDVAFDTIAALNMVVTFGLVGAFGLMGAFDLMASFGFVAFFDVEFVS